MKVYNVFYVVAAIFICSALATAAQASYDAGEVVTSVVCAFCSISIAVAVSFFLVVLKRSGDDNDKRENSFPKIDKRENSFPKIQNSKTLKIRNNGKTW